MPNRLFAAATAAAVLATSAFAGVEAQFSNQTVAAGLNVSHSTSGFNTFGYSGGGAVGDFNNDGWSDLFVISGGNGGKPDYLFINNGDGTFTNRAAEWGLTEIHKGKSACVGDYDGDGWLDLYVTSAGIVGQSTGPGHHKLYHNNGNGTFTDVAVAAGVNAADPNGETAWTCTFGDYDLDGDLDLYVGGFGGQTNNPNKLFRNDGNGTFTNVTASIGLFSGVGPIANLSARFIDMDGDLYPELILGGDFKGSGYVGSRYFKNNGDGTFTDKTVASGTGKEENGMGQTVGDFDNDERIDWYVTSIYHPPFGWTGNKLYRNMGDHVYTEYAASAGAADGGYGWGAAAVDVNHDGYEDIAETNGDATQGSMFYNEQSYLWMNNGDGTFTEKAVTSGLVFSIKGRSLLRLDYDNDGDQDLLICRNNGPIQFFRNDIPSGEPGAAWLRVFLDTSGRKGLAPNGWGAKVKVKTGGMTQTRSIDGGVSFLGTSEPSAHFGLGNARTVELVRVLWPDGSETVLNDVEVNQTITISAGAAPCVADLDGSGVVDGRDLAVLLGSWGGPGEGDVDGDGSVGGADLAIMLGAWGPCA